MTPPPSATDRLKIGALVGVRRINRRAIESWSRWSWVPWWVSRASVPAIVPAREVHGADLPEGLFVARPRPAEGRLGALYVAPYYGLAAAAFRAHFARPIDAATAWDEHAPWTPHFADNGEGWGNVQHDEQYVRLRTEGPNPFVLQRIDERTFEADLASAFEGTSRGARARFFQTEHGLLPGPITLRDGTTIAPHEPRFRSAKRIVNALDARDAIFGRHLGTVHLVLAQGLALAATRLPPSHPLHGVWLAHTRGTLEVNDFAFELLLSKTSYFAQSGFADRALAASIIAHRLARFRLEDAIIPRDLARRGIAGLPWHRYAIEAQAAWEVFEEHARAELDRLYPDDDAVRADAALRPLGDTLRAVLPGVPEWLAPIETRDALATWHALLVAQNLLHEVSGDYSPFALARDVEQKRTIRWDTLDDDHRRPSLREVLLFEQGAYTGLANARGNAMMSAPFERDPRLAHPFAEAWVGALRARLDRLSSAIAQRDAGRRHPPITRLYPRQWELSVSF